MLARERILLLSTFDIIFLIGRGVLSTSPSPGPFVGQGWN